ncbi:hypothetical protein F5879DRAFT_996299 [Lentinula edodes]|nr:hypothetical protein F5879DRAFT_996299 [Lentinula edodes]
MLLTLGIHLHVDKLVLLSAAVVTSTGHLYMEDSSCGKQQRLGITLLTLRHFNIFVKGIGWMSETSNVVQFKSDYQESGGMAR